LKDAVYNIATDPSNSRNVYADGNNIYKSTDGGVSFTAVLPIRLSVQTIAVLAGNPSAVFVGVQPGSNAFLTKWSSDGSQMIYSTYLGGSYGDMPSSVAIGRSR
jgi:hypothetical protein